MSRYNYYYMHDLEYICLAMDLFSQKCLTSKSQSVTQHMYNMKSNFKILQAKRSNWASKQGKIIKGRPVFVQALSNSLYHKRELSSSKGFYMVIEALNQIKKKTIDLCHAADILAQEILKALLMHGQPRDKGLYSQQTDCKYGDDFTKARLFGSNHCQGLVACLYANASPLSYCLFTLETIKNFQKQVTVSSLC